MALVAGLALVLYALSAPPGVVFEDDGEFAMAAYFLGVAHPPGYPLFVLLAKPFTWIPLGSVAWRVHMASGVFGALACAAMWWVVVALTKNRAAGFAAALSLACSRVFWSQAIIADVYTLNALLFLLLLALALAFVRTGESWLVPAMALSAGAALSNHWPLVLLAGPAILLALWPARQELWAAVASRPVAVTGAFILGLAPYAWMVWRSRVAPELAFYGQGIASWDDFWFYVSRAGYAGGGSSPTAGPEDRARFMLFWFRESAVQYAWLGTPFVVIGIATQWKRLGNSLSLALVWAFLSATAILSLVLNPDYQYLERAVFRVYPLVPYAVLSLWLGLGLAWTMERIRARLRPSTTRWVGAALAVGVVTSVMATHWSYNNRRQYDFAEQWGRGLLELFPPEAVVFTREDTHTFVLGYLHAVEGVRPDLELWTDWGIGIPPRGSLFDPIGGSAEDEERALVEYVSSLDRPAYSFWEPAARLAHTDLGLFYRIDGLSPGDGGDDNLELLTPIVEQYRWIEAQPEPSDEWTRSVRLGQISRMTRVLTAFVDLHPDPSFRREYGEDLARASETYSGLLQRISILRAQPGADPDSLLVMVERAKELVNPTMGKMDHATLYLLEGLLLRALERDHEALRALERSVAIYPGPDNVAVARLQEFRDERARAASENSR